MLKCYTFIKIKKLENFMIITKHNKLFIMLAFIICVLVVIMTVGVANFKTGLTISDATTEIASEQISTPSKAVNSSWYSWRNSSNISGNGSSASPYLIYTPQNLAYIGYQIKYDYGDYSSAHYKLMANLDMGGYYWTPIKTFSGTFDGNFKTIKNLILNENSTSDTSYGLFGKVTGGTIKNLGLNLNYSFTISSGISNAAGGLIGISKATNNITIQNCWVGGNIVVSCELPTLYVGSIIGYSDSSAASNKTTIVKDCFCDADLSVFSSTSQLYVGGMFGCFGSATAINVSTASPVKLSNLLFLGDINTYQTTKTPVISGIVAELMEEPKSGVTHEIKNCYYNSTKLDTQTAVETQPNSNFSNVAGLTVNMLTLNENLVGFDFTSVWEREPYVAQDPDKKLMPRLAGFTYPEVQYVALTFLLDGEVYALKHVVQYSAFNDFPTLPEKDGLVGLWSVTDINGNYYDFSYCAYDASFRGFYMNSENSVTVSYVAVEMVAGQPVIKSTFETIAVSKGSKAFKIIAPTRSGFTFYNWYANSNLTTVYNWNNVVNGNITIYARYDPAIYNVKVHDGENVIYDKNIEYNQKIDFVAPTKEGYTFDRLYTDSNFTWGFNMSTGITYSRNLYAKYTPNPLVVTFKYEGYNEYNVWGELTKNVNIHYDETIAEEDYPTVESKTGYDKTPIKWMLDGVEWESETKVQSDLTLVAEYTINTYVVTFKYPDLIKSVVINSGKDMVIKTVIVKYGDSVPPPNETEVGGFSGYKRSSPAWDNMNFDLVMEDRTYTAQFKISAYKISFIKSSTDITTIDVVPGGELSLDDLPEIPHKIGYDQKDPYWVFDGRELRADDLKNVSGNIEITAKYFINQYTVQYKMPDGTITEVKVNHGGTVGQVPTYGLSLFQQIHYSAVAENVTEDMVVDVTVTSFAGTVYAVAGGVVALSLGFILFKALRRKKAFSGQATITNRLR